MKKTEKKIIGYCGVDSGQILLIDPCYLADWKHGEFNPDDSSKEFKNHYDSTCKITCSEKGAGQLLVADACGSGVVSSSGYGDGNYPVYATIVDEGEWGKRIKSLTIKFF